MNTRNCKENSHVYIIYEMALQRGEKTFEVTFNLTEKNEEGITLCRKLGEVHLSWVNSKLKYLEAKTIQMK